MKVIRCAGNVMLLERVRLHPRMARIHGFLTHEECDRIIEHAKGSGQMHRSYTAGSISDADANVDDSGSKRVSKSVVNPRRTSYNCRIERNVPVAFAALTRAAALADLSPAHSEPLQVVHYDKTQQYAEHWDFFDPTSPGYNERIGTQGQRLVTVFVYLNDCAEGGGGCTHFPKLDLRFRPTKGTAVLW
jgi:prolyl 4-hydroxylase